MKGPTSSLACAQFWHRSLRQEVLKLSSPTACPAMGPAGFSSDWQSKIHVCELLITLVASSRLVSMQPFEWRRAASSSAWMYTQSMPRIMSISVWLYSKRRAQIMWAVHGLLKERDLWEGRLQGHFSPRSLLAVHMGITPPMRGHSIPSISAAGSMKSLTRLGFLMRN